MRKVYKLLGILQSYAPNAKAQYACIELMDKAIADGAVERDLERMFVNYLADGLNYNNWPWKD